MLTLSFYSTWGRHILHWLTSLLRFKDNDPTYPQSAINTVMFLTDQVNKRKTNEIQVDTTKAVRLNCSSVLYFNLFTSQLCFNLTVVSKVLQRWPPLHLSANLTLLQCYPQCYCWRLDPQNESIFISLFFHRVKQAEGPVLDRHRTLMISTLIWVQSNASQLTELQKRDQKVKQTTWTVVPTHADLTFEIFINRQLGNPTRANAVLVL